MRVAVRELHDPLTGVLLPAEIRPVTRVTDTERTRAGICGLLGIGVKRGVEAVPRTVRRYVDSDVQITEVEQPAESGIIALVGMGIEIVEFVAHRVAAGQLLPLDHDMFRRVPVIGGVGKQELIRKIAVHRIPLSQRDRKIENAVEEIYGIDIRDLT